MKNVIDNLYIKNNYLSFINFIKNKKNICIVGKGKLNKPIEDKYDVYIGTKNTLNIIPRPDILQLNDFEGLFGNEKYIKELKYILVPINIHFNSLPSFDITYLNFIEYIYTFKFTGKIIFYKINNDLFNFMLKNFKKKNPLIKCKIYDWDFISLNTNSSADIFQNLLINLKINFEINLDYYGICKNNDCNPDIEKNLKNSKTILKYENIKNNYIKRKYKNNSNHFYNINIPKYKLGFKNNKFIKTTFF